MPWHEFGPRTQDTFTWLLHAEVIVQVHVWEDRDAWLEIIDALACAPALAVSAVLDVADALEVVPQWLERTDGHVLIGMSKVETETDVRAAVQAGASFLLSPTFHAASFRLARSLDVLYLPGVFTLDEALAAYRGGAKAQFLFPAEILGPEHLARLRHHLPEAFFFPGVNLAPATLPAYRRAGAQAAVIEPPFLASPHWTQAQLITYVRKALRAWRQAHPQT